MKPKSYVEEELKKIKESLETMREFLKLDFSVLKNKSGKMPMYNRESVLKDFLNENGFSFYYRHSSFVLLFYPNHSATEGNKYYPQYEATFWDGCFAGKEGHQVKIDAIPFRQDSEERLAVTLEGVNLYLQEYREREKTYQDLVDNYSEYKKKHDTIVSAFETEMKKLHFTMRSDIRSY